MPPVSAGLLMFRVRCSRLQVLLAHPGGPLWRNKDEGAWTIPKGEVQPGEDALDAAIREFEEETGCRPSPPYIPLGVIRQKSGKRVHAWAFEGDCDPAQVRSNVFSMEWPPKSGKQQQFPEIDRAEFFSMDEARKKINPAQAAFADTLELACRGRGVTPEESRGKP